MINGDNTGLGQVPPPPAALDRNGAIGLSADAEVLVARDRALRLDESGASDPDAAAKAWREVAALDGANPFKEEAAVRALQWEDFGKEQRDFMAQKSADFQRLTQILPLTSVTEENKVQLLTNYGGLYGEADMVNLISVVQPADVRARLCAPYLQSGTSPVRVDMPVDRDGEPFKGEIVVAEVKFGKAPTMINLPSCATSMPIEVTESESGKTWAGVVPGLGGSDPTIISPEYDDLIPWSFWHDYLTASSPSGPLIGVMFSQMTLPSEFNRSTVQSLRGNVELGVGGGWAGDFSLWFEPSMSIEDSGVERAIGLAGGLGLGRFSAGRFSLSPLRVGYQKFLNSDIDGMEGFTGHAALRFHVGGGVQLRGDAGVLRAAVNQSGQDVEGWAWSAGGGLEYGNPVIYNAVGSLFESEGNSSSSDEWTEWTDGSLSFGYNVAQGYLPKQDFIGTMIFMTKFTEYDDGAYVSIEGAYTGLLGLDSTNFALRLGMASMNDDEDVVYQLGFIGAYNGFEESDYYMLGMEGELAYHLVSQLSIHGYVSLNALALSDTEGETKDEVTQEVIGKTTTMSPVSAYLRWVTPANIYFNAGVRADITGSMPISGVGEAGYVMSLD
ncbi:MAG: hypothetical protein R3E66_14865 [bacterium]